MISLVSDSPAVLFLKILQEQEQHRLSWLLSGFSRLQVVFMSSTIIDGWKWKYTIEGEANQQSVGHYNPRHLEVVFGSELYANRLKDRGQDGHSGIVKQRVRFLLHAWLT